MQRLSQSERITYGSNEDLLIALARFKRFFITILLALEPLDPLELHSRFVPVAEVAEIAP